MTCIAYRFGIIAADTQLTCGDWSKGRVHKLRPMPGGGVYACAGESGATLRMQRWIDRGMPKRGRPRIKDEIEIDVLMVRPDGSVWMLDDSLVFEPRADEFIAIGSGAQYALGAMKRDKRCSARSAIVVAAEFDSNTSAPVDVVRIAVIRDRSAT